MAHPWHDIPPRPETGDLVHAIVEIPKGSKAKFEIHKQSGLIKLDRMLFSAVHYPANYGFIPQTYAGDNDPLDILVLCQSDLPPLTLVEARVIGVMRMRDRNETDDKILAVAHSDVSLSHIHQLNDLPDYVLAEIRRFYEDYKKLEQRSDVVVEEILDLEAAREIIDAAILLYKETFGDKA
jgi:inorganic pyrophosphatase